MDTKRPVDIKRDSGGQADIGSEADGAIVEMFEYNGILLTIKERSIYELALADNIDPKRENPDLPTTVHRLVLNRGTESELVCRTFLTAKRLFKESCLLQTVNTTNTLSLAMEAVKELVTLDDEINEYLNFEKKVSEEYEERRGKKLSYSIPSVTDVNTRCKTIFQKADHVTQTLMEIITVFYPNSGLTKQSHFPRFHEFLKKQYGDGDNFAKFIEDSVKFLELVRSLRNCLDHRLKEVQVKDFELQVSSDVLSPTIEIKPFAAKHFRDS